MKQSWKPGTTIYLLPAVLAVVVIRLKSITSLR